MVQLEKREAVLVQDGEVVIREQWDIRPYEFQLLSSLDLVAAVNFPDVFTFLLSNGSQEDVGALISIAGRPGYIVLPSLYGVILEEESCGELPVGYIKDISLVFILVWSIVNGFSICSGHYSNVVDAFHSSFDLQGG